MLLVADPLGRVDKINCLWKFVRQLSRVIGVTNSYIVVSEDALRRITDLSIPSRRTYFKRRPVI
jgi:hypothetical protein